MYQADIDKTADFLCRPRGQIRRVQCVNVPKKCLTRNEADRNSNNIPLPFTETPTLPTVLYREEGLNSENSDRNVVRLTEKAESTT
jgi:hypothetical protein